MWKKVRGNVSFWCTVWTNTSQDECCVPQWPQVGRCGCSRQITKPQQAEIPELKWFPKLKRIVQFRGFQRGSFTTRRHLTIYEDKFGCQNCLVFGGKLLFASREWSPRLLLSIPQYMRQTPLQILITSTLVIAQRRETLVCLKVNLTRFPSELKS